MMGRGRGWGRLWRCNLSRCVCVCVCMCVFVYVYMCVSYMCFVFIPTHHTTPTHTHTTTTRNNPSPHPHHHITIPQYHHTTTPQHHRVCRVECVWCGTMRLVWRRCIVTGLKTALTYARCARGWGGCCCSRGMSDCLEM